MLGHLYKTIKINNQKNNPSEETHEVLWSPYIELLSAWLERRLNFLH